MSTTNEKLYLQVEKENDVSVEGLLKFQLNQSSLFIQFKLMNIFETNEICNHLNFLKIHSVQSPYEIDSSVDVFAHFKWKNSTHFNMFVFLFFFYFKLSVYFK